MEVEFNELFDAYRELYFEGGTSSVYLWDLEQGFAGCFLIKKSKATNTFLRLLLLSVSNFSLDVGEGDRYVKNGSWNSIHVVEAIENDSKSATYKLTTTVMLSMNVNKQEVGETLWSGSLTRQVGNAKVLSILLLLH